MDVVVLSSRYGIRHIDTLTWILRTPRSEEHILIQLNLFGMIKEQ